MYEEEIWVVQYRLKGTAIWFPNPSFVYQKQESCESEAAQRRERYPDTEYRATRYLPEYL